MPPTGLENCNTLICNKYRIVSKIGEGTYGVCYLGYDTWSGQFVALKVESADTQYPLLHYEYKLYQWFHGGYGIPNVRWFGQFQGYHVMIMDILGPSLEKLFNYCSRRFTPATVALLALQMISRLQYIHEKCYIHRDLKPDNFVMGAFGEKKNIVYLIDYGLASQFCNPMTGSHIQFKKIGKMIGNLRFMSISANFQMEQSRRDDMESLGYVLAYFNRAGQLPWSGMKAETGKQKTEKVAEKKLSTSIVDLCKGFPHESSMIAFLAYCRHMAFDEMPDYNNLRLMFLHWFTYHPNYYKFDWVIKTETENPILHVNPVSHPNPVVYSNSVSYANPVANVNPVLHASPVSQALSTVNMNPPPI